MGTETEMPMYGDIPDYRYRIMDYVGDGFLGRRIVGFRLPLHQGLQEFAQRWTPRRRHPRRPHKLASRRRQWRRRVGCILGLRERHVPRPRREGGPLELRRRRLWLGQSAPGRPRCYAICAPRRRNVRGACRRSVDR